MSSFGCCLWWFLLGALLGWLLNYLLCKGTKNNNSGSGNQLTPPPAPAAKLASTPVAAAPVMKAAEPVKAPTPAPVKKAAPAKPAAKPKAKPKAKAPAKAVDIDLKAARAAGFKIKNADDLTIIEGIGPKINELFRNAGLKTFKQVSTATVPQMRKILDDGGSRFRIANPSTWAQQAKLAANNQWKALNKLQDELSGGVKK